MRYSEKKYMIKKLKQYKRIQTDIDLLKMEIDDLPNIYKSPELFANCSHGSEPSNPTEQAAFRIIRKKEEYNRKILELLELKDEIDLFIDSIDDPTVKRIVKCAYVFGMTWDAVGHATGYHPKAAHRKFMNWYHKKYKVK